jgi:hypothetical protein
VFSGTCSASKGEQVRSYTSFRVESGTQKALHGHWRVKGKGGCDSCYNFPIMEQCWYAKPEWWLVILGFPTLIFIGWQAWETRRAATAARDAVVETGKNASAALLNADAIIRSERPWIFVEESEGTKAVEPKRAHVRILARNKGRTPAEVTVNSCTFAFLAYDWAFPDEPTYPKEELLYRNYVAPAEEPFEVYDFDCLQILDDGGWKELGTKRLTFTGHIVYRDLITKEEHETRFCYFLSPVPMVGLVRTGPRSYNQHT